MIVKFDKNNQKPYPILWFSEPVFCIYTYRLAAHPKKHHWKNLYSTHSITAFKTPIYLKSDSYY